MKMKKRLHFIVLSQRGYLNNKKKGHNFRVTYAPSKLGNLVGIIISTVTNFINHTAQLDGLFKLTIRGKSDHKKFSTLIIWKDKMKN